MQFHKAKIMTNKSHLILLFLVHSAYSSCFCCFCSWVDFKVWSCRYSDYSITSYLYSKTNSSFVSNLEILNQLKVQVLLNSRDCNYLLLSWVLDIATLWCYFKSWFLFTFGLPSSSWSTIWIKRVVYEWASFSCCQAS